jgi:exodeoxyribonuclease VII small subunit
MENQTFESLLKELEQVVKDLESKDITLDESVKKYQRGIELSKTCYEMLEKAEKLVVKEIKS